SDKAIALKSDDPHFWNNRGTYLESMFRFRGATTSYQTAQALKPDDPILEKNLTAVQNKYAGLCQSLAKEVKDFEEWPEEQQSYYVRGVMAFRDGEMLRTSEQFLLAIQRFKEAAKFLTGLPGETW